MKNEILELVKKTGGGVTFVDLSKLQGFSGEYWFGEAENNIFYWFACSEKGAAAINELRRDGRIALVETSPLTYAAYGFISPYPVVAKAKKYKEPRWQPTAINKGLKF